MPTDVLADGGHTTSRSAGRLRPGHDAAPTRRPRGAWTPSSESGDSRSVGPHENRPIGELLQILGLAVLSMANPALLAAVTVLLLLPNPKRLMLGYLLGALLTSVAAGLVVVFALEETGAASTARNTVGPAQDIVLGCLLLAAALALRSERPGRRRKARRAAKAGEDRQREALPVRLLGRGSTPVAFGVGVLLSFPGATYLIGLGHIDRLGAGTAAVVLLVIGFCLIQLLLLEAPLLGYLVAPERTAVGVAGLRSWLARNGRRAGADLAAMLGIALLLRAAIVFLA